MRTRPAGGDEHEVERALVDYGIGDADVATLRVADLGRINVFNEFAPGEVRRQVPRPI